MMKYKKNRKKDEKDLVLLYGIKLPKIEPKKIKKALTTAKKLHEKQIRDTSRRIKWDEYCVRVYKRLLKELDRGAHN